MSRWIGTVAYLVGMVLTALNVYPLNLVFGAVGGVAWCVTGIKWRENALVMVEAASAGIYLFGLIRWGVMA